MPHIVSLVHKFSSKINGLYFIVSKLRDRTCQLAVDDNCSIFSFATNGSCHYRCQKPPTLFKTTGNTVQYRLLESSGFSSEEALLN